MMLCPNCQQGELKGEKMGWRCEFCDEFFTIEMLIIYDEENNEEKKLPDADAEPD